MPRRAAVTASALQQRKIRYENRNPGQLIGRQLSELDSLGSRLVTAALTSTSHSLEMLESLEVD